MTLQLRSPLAPLKRGEQENYLLQGVMKLVLPLVEITLKLKWGQFMNCPYIVVFSSVLDFGKETLKP
jgi:hypothetical protein